MFKRPSVDIRRQMSKIYFPPVLEQGKRDSLMNGITRLKQWGIIVTKSENLNLMNYSPFNVGNSNKNIAPGREKGFHVQPQTNPIKFF